MARSIRLRLLLIALVGLGAALVISGAGLVSLFSGHVERRAAQELDGTIAALAGQIEFDAGGTVRLRRQPADPAYQTPLSGRYWQVREVPGENQVRSISLWDGSLELAEEVLPPGETRISRSTAPDEQALLQSETTLIISGPAADRQVRVAAAMATSELDALRRGFARDLMPALLLFGVLVLAGAWLQVGAGLRPLVKVREGLRRIRSGSEPRLSAEAPSEIAPLVGEINALLEAREHETERARNRAADLAHGMRTPLTALVADAERLRALGHPALADSIAQTAGQMQRTIERELARARRRSDPTRGSLPPQRVRAAAEAVARTLARTADGERVAIELEIEGDLQAAVDPDDLHDLLGNLLENAVRAAQAKVTVSGVHRGDRVAITVEDDGTGISPHAVDALAVRGARLDERGGAGLGLAIVTDILAAYGTEPHFHRGRLGGLGVSFELPG